MPDGMLLMALQYNVDNHFSPWFQMRSCDNGRTWTQPTDNVPRICWWHGFADGELFEIDTYGVQDPNAPGESVYYGSWSFPSRPNDVPRKELVRMRHTQRGQTAREMKGLPRHAWWPLWRQVHGDQAKGWGEFIWEGQDKILVNGPYFTDIVELPDGRLLAAGYWDHVAVYESLDRGRHWDEIGILRITPGDHQLVGNETALRRLCDGRLYAVIRTDGKPWTMKGSFHHAWSEDEGRTWSDPVPLVLDDEPDHTVGCAWPRLAAMEDGTLVLTYGRPGKNMVFDPTGSGEHWQGRLDLHAWELDTQALNGVPPEQRLRGMVGVDWTTRWDRQTDSGDYLGVAVTGPRELLVTYDVQSYVENWNAFPESAIRMVRVRLAD
jgi:hypothetical protein